MAALRSFTLLHAGRTVIGPWWDHDLRAPWWRVYRNDCGGARILHPGGSTPLPAGRVVVVPPWGAFRSAASGPIGHQFLHGDVIGLPAAWIQTRCPRPVVLPADPVIEGLLAREDGDPLALQAAACLALDRVLAPWREDLAGLGRPPAVLAPAFERIAGAESFRLTVAGLAAACGLSPDHFARRFRAELGMSPARWLLRRRLDRAAGRLATTADPIDAIAADAGFADRFHFSRAFRAAFGLPPARYRTDQGRHGRPSA